MIVCLTGASGFIGQRLAKALIACGHTVVGLDRVAPKQPLENMIFVKVDLLAEKIPLDVLKCEAVIHLAGVNIFGRWTKQYKEAIYSSRVVSARKLAEFFTQNKVPLKAFITASATGFYDEAGDSIIDESMPQGSGFLSRVCASWEEASKSIVSEGTRWVAIRTGVVLGAGGGMLSKLLPLFKLGLGGKLGTGSQWFSWIHLDDLINIYVEALTRANPGFEGAYNAVAPAPVTNLELTHKLGQKLGKPTWFSVPAWAIKLFLGEVGNTVLQSQRVMPQRLLSQGFKFKYSEIDQALSDTI